MQLIPPRFTPPLDDAFRLAALANRAFREAVAASGGGEPLILALERNDGGVGRLEKKSPRRAVRRNPSGGIWTDTALG